MDTYLLGEHVDFPVGASPTAFHCLAHPDGELATARGEGTANLIIFIHKCTDIACSAMGSVMVSSIFSNKSMEEIAEASGDGLRWQQMYLSTDRSLTKGFVRRAELAGFKAIVVTIDSPALPRKMGFLRNDWHLPPHMELGNYPNFTKTERLELSFHSAATWDDVQWLVSLTRLPVVVKGLLRAEEVELAVESGAAAILVSNHGGRQLNTDIATVRQKLTHFTYI